jgi:hypothetical protein
MARADLNSDRGEDFPFEGSILKAGAPYPTGSWTGFGLRFEARRKRGAVALISKTITNGGITVGGSGTGMYSIHIAAADTSGFTVAELLDYELWLDEPDGSSTRVAYGTWRVDL